MNLAKKAARLLKLVLKFTVTRPNRLSHVMGCALAAAEEVNDPETDLLRFPYVAPEDILPEEGNLSTITLGLFNKTHASLSVLEWITLVLLLKKAKAQSVFEFGTYKGVSITQLALNLAQDSQIRTLDLPDQSSIELKISDPDELQIAREGGKGSLVPEHIRARVQFLKQDSAKFDASSLAGKVDFIFVDGAHSYDYVRNDSQKAWQMLRSGGIVAWHDCRVADPDVVKYLLESDYNPKRIIGTSLAFAIKP